MNVIIYELHYLSLTIPSIALGVLAMYYIMSRRAIMRPISRLGRWITALSGLPSYCSLPFMVSFVSPSTASSMLVTMYKDSKLTRRELYIASLINAFPALLSHLRTLIPVLLGTMGIYGLLYLLILMTIGLMQMMIFAALGRWGSNKDRVQGSITEPIGQVVSNSLNLRMALKFITRIVLITSITSAALITIELLGLNNYLNNYLTRAFSTLSPYAVSLIMAYVINDNAAFAAAGTLINEGFNGILIVKWLLIGYVASSLIRGIRHNAPYYLGIYGPKDGITIMLISTLTRALLALLILGILYLI
ncbi:conserved hypothetical protein [Vulcanisaeta distributa DSM 14429]|uniref:Nucleoside recognition domain protein n=2 Tax=Vulcanisaeta distributa TaxID=164451 RepID=E1QNI6_VULDI|nr:conserved hypothetical protein [Vulcanisaeta distributa DSM 14429]